MNLVEETKTLEYGKMEFGELEEGDVFEYSNGYPWMKTCELFYSGHIYNAARLADGSLGHYLDTDVVYPLNATLHYERILEGE